MNCASQPVAAWVFLSEQNRLLTADSVIAQPGNIAARKTHAAAIASRARTPPVTPARSQAGEERVNKLERGDQHASFRNWK
jgi:hypothetical protein